MAEGMSPSDVAMLARNEDGFGNSWFGMIIVLFFLVYGMGGNWGNRFDNAIGYENLATSNEVQRGFDNQNSMANQRDILAATNQVFHDMSNVFNDKYSELQRDIAGLAVGQANQLAKQNECCCQTLRAIDGVNYNTAMQTAQINTNTTEQIQRVLDAITGNRMADMQERINKLELEQAMAGVVRYPNAFAYSAGPNPFCSCGGGCCNI